MSLMTHTAEARWRAACLASLAAFAALALIALMAGVAPGDAAIRQGLIDGRTATTLELARRVNHGGTFRVLVPAMLLLFALSPVVRRHWWLWGAALAGSGVAETAAKFLIFRTHDLRRMAQALSPRRRRPA